MALIHSGKREPNRRRTHLMLVNDNLHHFSVMVMHSLKTEQINDEMNGDVRVG